MFESLYNVSFFSLKLICVSIMKTPSPTLTHTTSVKLTYSERNCIEVRMTFWKRLILLNEESVSNSQGHICAAKLSSIYSPPTTRSQTHSFLPPDSFLLSCHPTPTPICILRSSSSWSSNNFCRNLLIPPLPPLQSCTPFFHVFSTVSLESLSDHLGIKNACFCLLNLLIFICGYFAKVGWQFLAYKKQWRNSQKQTLWVRKPSFPPHFWSE